MKQRSDLPKDRISLKNQIFLDGEQVGKIIKKDKIKYAKFINVGFSKEELIRIAELI